MPMSKQSLLRRLPAGALAVALSVGCVTAWAQAGGQGNSTPSQPPKPSSVAPPPADLEPGVNTSATSMSSEQPAPASVPAQKSAPSPSKPATVARSKAAVPAAATTDGATGPGAAGSGSANSAPAKVAGTATSAVPKSGAPGKAHDNLELDTTQITGNRELPKVLYIVPWKRSDLGDLVGKPVNSILDEVLTPVDRDVFKRQNRYYDALKPDGANQAPGSAASDSTEKH
jgi:hypothetical protein